MTELENILLKAIAEVMYETNHCYICGKHIAHHTSNCAWVAAQQSVQLTGLVRQPVSGEYFIEYVESDVVRLTPRN